MGKIGFVIQGIALCAIVVFNIFYCFRMFFTSDRKSPEFLTKIANPVPTTVAFMNYNSVILTGVVFLTTCWWLVVRKVYVVSLTYHKSVTLNLKKLM
jgi:hypothetical protein